MKQDVDDVSTQLRPICHSNLVQEHKGRRSVADPEDLILSMNQMVLWDKYIENRLDMHWQMDVIRLTIMRRGKPKRPFEAKEAALSDQGALHPRSGAVQDESFKTEDFFDPRDLVQVRYEMLRRHTVEGKSVTEIAARFGVSRQAFYKTREMFELHGIGGLLPRQRGPKRAHKCTEEVLDFVLQWREKSLDKEKSVVEAVRKEFGIVVNHRSIERALARRKKKQRKGPKG